MPHWIATGPGGLDDFALVETDLGAPAPGQVRIDVVAAGVNPADLKHARAATRFPLPIGYEVAGRIGALGPQTSIASGPAQVGDPVLAFRVRGGYASSIVVPAADVFTKPAGLGFDEAAGLLLAATTAADLLRAARATAGDLVLLHGASGAVGVMVLQLAARRGIRVIGTASDRHLARVRGFGGLAVGHGSGLARRLTALVGTEPISAALDAAGTDEAIDTSLALVADRSRIVTVAAPARAAADGFVALGGRQPVSKAFRDAVRGELIAAAGRGELTVPVAARFALDEAPDALRLVAGGHAGGKVVLHPSMRDHA
ncbi:MAG: NADP-dependent oxidoreductase [Gordonia sp. (in: high G+C Gram-positive bacteria)]